MDQQTKPPPIPVPLAFSIKIKHQRKETPIRELVNELKLSDRLGQPTQQPSTTTRTERYTVDPKLIGRCTEELESLQQAITKELEEERQRLEALRNFAAANDEIMLANYKIIRQVDFYLGNLSKALQAESYPAQIYRNYRLVYEGICRLSTKLQNYKSINLSFLEARQQIINDKDKQQHSKTSLALIDEPSQADHSRFRQSSVDSLEMQMRRVSEPTTSGFSNRGKSKMEVDIHALEQRMKDDNDQFVRVIKKYNSILFQLQGDICVLEDQLRVKDRLLYDLENENVQLRQEKIRDELVIKQCSGYSSNLTKKLRHKGMSAGIMHPSPERRQHHTLDKLRLSPQSHSTSQLLFRGRQKTRQAR